MTSGRGTVAHRTARAVVPRSVRPLVWRVFVKPRRPSRGATERRWRWPVDRYRYQPVRRRLSTYRQEVHLGARRLGNRHRRLPDFVGIGTTKSGTTSLAMYLWGHPEVYPPVRKEVRFFTLHHHRGAGWYRAQFPLDRNRAAQERRVGRPTVTGELSPAYFIKPEAPARVAELLPDAKLIVMVREPAIRAISHYEMRRRNRVERRTLHDAVVEDLARAGPGVLGPRGEAAVLDPGYYAHHLQRWYEHVDRDRILVVPLERLTTGDPCGFDRILDFLDLSPWRPAEFRNVNPGRYPPTDDDLRCLLREHYAPYTEDLWDLLGERWSEWD